MGYDVDTEKSWEGVLTLVHAGWRNERIRHVLQMCASCI